MFLSSAAYISQPPCQLQALQPLPSSKPPLDVSLDPPTSLSSKHINESGDNLSRCESRQYQFDDEEEEDDDDAGNDNHDFACDGHVSKSEGGSETVGSGRASVQVSPEKIFFGLFDGKSSVASLDVENYFLEHTTEQVEGYDKEFIIAIRDENVEEARRLHREEGHLLQVANRFGESIIHMACRQGSMKMVRFLVEEGGTSLRVRDDYGRTPLHDVCWAANPKMELLQYLLQREPEMLWMKDARGFTPLGYVRREHWHQFHLFLATNRKCILGLRRRDGGCCEKSEADAGLTAMHCKKKRKKT